MHRDGKRHREKQRRKPLEINLISRGRQGLELRNLEVKRTKLEIGLFYNDDFGEVNEVITQRLNNDKDKGDRAAVAWSYQAPAKQPTCVT